MVAAMRDRPALVQRNAFIASSPIPGWVRSMNTVRRFIYRCAAESTIYRLMREDRERFEELGRQVLGGEFPIECERDVLFADEYRGIYTRYLRRRGCSAPFPRTR